MPYRPYAFLNFGFVLLSLLAQVCAFGAEPVSIISLLEMLRGEGINVIYSSQLVRPEMEAPVGAAALAPLERAQQALAANGLELREIGPARYIVTAAVPAAAAPSGSKDSPLSAQTVPAAPPEVSVYASRYDLGDDALGEPHFLAQTQIEQVPGAQDDALRAARVVPGVATNASTRPYIRGSFVDDVLVQFDGVPLSDPFHLKNFQSLVSAFDPEAVKGIELYSGGFPVSYGTKSGGVIDVQPRSLSSGYEHSVGASLMAYGLSSVGRSEHLPIEWLATFRHSNSDIALRPLNARDGEPSFLDSLGRLRWLGDDGSAWTAGWLLLEDHIELATISADELANAHYHDDYLWLVREQPFGERLQSRTSLSGTWTDRVRQGTLREPGVAIENVDETRNNSRADLRSLWSYRPNTRVAWTFGVEASHSSADLNYDRSGTFDTGVSNAFGRPVDATLVARAEPEVLTYAGFVAARRRWSTLEFELGLRLDAQDYDDSTARRQFSPRLNVRYDLSAAWRLYGSWGRFTQAQRVDEWRMEDPQVEPDPSASAIHSVIGLVYQPSAEYRVSLELYRKRWTQVGPYYDNLLDRLSLVPDLSPDRIRVVPMASEAAGAELSVRRMLSPSFEAWGGFTAATVSDDLATVSDVRRSWDQPRAFTLGLGWKDSAWSASAVLGWHQGWPRTSVTATPGRPASFEMGPRNAERWGNYFSADLSAAHTARFGGGELSTWFEVSNLSGRRNPCCEHLLGLPPEEGSSATQLNSWLPRVINVGVTWRFLHSP